jgi:hypothetical protein
MSELPDNIKRFDILKVEHGINKLCQCYGTPRYTLDTRNRLVYCDDCGAIVDPFEALSKVASHYEYFAEESQHMLEQRRQLLNWKPWLLVFRNLERSYRSKENLPCCPECKKPFYFEHINTWVNRKMEELRREREKKEMNNNG